MQNHTGCICLSFLHHGFSNVSSNCWDQYIQNHKGCIFLSFPHRAFSYVFSNCLDKRMHSRIGCICLSFLHRGFSNEYLYCLPYWMPWLYFPHFESLNKESFHSHPNLQNVDPSQIRYRFREKTNGLYGHL